MKLPRIRSILLSLIVLFTAIYIFGAISIASRDNPIAPLEGTPASYETIAIFGASGTAGDGILKAALAAPEIKTIHVYTRRATPRIKEGIASGKVHMTLHMDYMDYSAIKDQIAKVDTVFWAIGISSLGVDEETYAKIHTDFPHQFIKTWTSVNNKPEISFHFISSSDISEDSSAMWVRQKIRAEKTLFKFAEGSNLKVIAYRPDYIRPTDEEAHMGHKMLYGFFAPVGAAVIATEIGQAMIEITARGKQFKSGDKISTWKILSYSNAYAQRLSATGVHNN